MNTVSDIKKLKAEFEKDGYVVLREFLHIEEMQDLRRRIEQYIVNVVPDMPGNRVFFEDKNDSTTLKQLQDMQLYDPYFAAYLYKSKFEDLAANLLDETVIGKTIEYS